MSYQIEQRFIFIKNIEQNPEEIEELQQRGYYQLPSVIKKDDKSILIVDHEFLSYWIIQPEQLSQTKNLVKNKWNMKIYEKIILT